MKILKTLIALILSVILLASVGMAMCSFAVDKSLSEESIEKAISETNAVDKLTDRILEQNTVNMGGEYGESMKAILKSDTMTDFFTAYTAKALRDQVYGDGGTEIGTDEMNQAFSEGMDECRANGSISMNSGERLLFDQALNSAMPNLTEGINYVLTQMNLTSFVDEETQEQIETAKKLASPEVRYGTIGIAIIICLIIIAFFWRSKLGMIWCSFCILLIAGFFWLIAMMLEGTMESSGDYLALSTKMLAVMISYGADYVAIATGLIGLAFIPGCLILRLLSRAAG